MKRLITLLLATGMLLSAVSVTAMAAASDVTYPVGGIRKDGFLADEDGVVDLDHPKKVIPYGEKIYYPLLNSKYNGNSAALAELENKKNAAKTESDAADSAHAAAVEAANDLADAISSFQTTITQKTGELTNGSTTLKSAFQTERESAVTKINDACTFYTNLSALNTKLTDVKGSWAAFPITLPVAFGDVSDALLTNIEACITHYTEEEADTVLAAAAEDAKTMATALKNSKQAYFGDQTAEYWTTIKSAIDNTYTTDYANGYIDAYFAGTGDTDELDALKAWFKNINGSSSITIPDIAAIRSAIDTATAGKAEAETEKAAQDAEVTHLLGIKNTKNEAYNTALANYNAALSSSVDYMFVNDTEATAKARLKASWDLGSKYIKSVELKRVKAESSLYSLSKGSKIMFLVITLKEGSSTREVEVEGDIDIKQTGSLPIDLRLPVSLTIDYESAGSSNDGLIGITPKAFRDGHGFDADDEFTFYFEDDDDSYFEVNTNSQKEIVLAFDTDYDDDLAERIEKKNPNADLEFYNGNYARFSKTGTLYLYYPSDNGKAYLYSISSSGELSSVKAEYDEFDETFAIRTNTLGRYLISNEKLSSLSSSSGSSSSSAKPTASASVAPASKPASSKPASVPAPASSVAPPASKPSSTTPPASEPPMTSSEPLSIEEPSSEEEESSAIIVNNDPEDDLEDVPTKEGGISWIVWVLIAAGVAAVLIAVGVIFYTRKSSGRRML